MESVKIKHFVTHSDFGINHIGRNLALKQAGVETWYFTDSMNQGCNWKEGKGVQHPFWAYLYYDNHVTWDELLAKYFSQHPESFKKAHVIGCLWSGHIKHKSEKLTSKYGLSSKHLKDRFLLTAFDSTFSRNGLTSYEEGLAFAEHLLQLVSDYPDIYLFLKEKKQRRMHCLFDPELGPALLELYARMDAHPRITTYSDKDDSSDLISVADMVISFPFTSTTFETLSINKPAIWHDPLGYYINTPYAKAGGVTTHSYDELKLKIREMKNMDGGGYQNPFPKDSPLMDPYRDGKAIDRFRHILLNGEMQSGMERCF